MVRIQAQSSTNFGEVSRSDFAMGGMAPSLTSMRMTGESHTVTATVFTDDNTVMSIDQSVSLLSEDIMSGHTSDSTISRTNTNSSRDGSMPSMSRSGSSVSCASANTGAGAAAIEGPVLEQEHGHPVARLEGVYQCMMWFRGCRFRSDNKEEWAAHENHYFYLHSPPNDLTCPLCRCKILGPFSTVFLEHLASHNERGEDLTENTRPCLAFSERLLKRKVIHHDEHKRYIRGERGSQPHTTMNERRRRHEVRPR